MNLWGVTYSLRDADSPGDLGRASVVLSSAARSQFARASLAVPDDDGGIMISFPEFVKKLCRCSSGVALLLNPSLGCVGPISARPAG